LAGQLTALSMWERRTAETESSLLPTATVADSYNDKRTGGATVYIDKFGKPRRKTENGSASMGLARLVQWPTPAAQDAKNATLPPSQMDLDTVPGAVMRAGDAGSLSPRWVEWLQVFPDGWTDLEP
jgi:hypothetical protein